jgi:UDP-N-acetylmuramate dehydrogenase
LDVELHKNFDIKNLTAFKVGGEISNAYFIHDVKDLELLKDNFKILGNISNTLVSSDGYDGTVVLTSKMDKIVIDGNIVKVQSGVKGPKLAQMVAEHNLSGLEFMIGFPGSVGGEVFMNASAHGQAISDCIKSVTMYSPEKGVFTLSKDKMGFDYRTSNCQKNDWVVLEVEFELIPKTHDEIELKMKENLEFRKSHQPSLALPNCGSVFKNPEGNSAGRLLDEAGVKGLKVGGAEVWEGHANFIVNKNKSATSEDILKLMCLMKNKVKEKFGINLYPEILYLGNRNKNEEDLCKILNQK